MKPIMTTFILSAFLLLITALPVLAHEGHQHKVMGTVAAIDDVQIKIKGKDGNQVSIQLQLDTEYKKGDQPATLADVKVGERVVVTYSEHEGHEIAHEVRLPADKKKTTKKDEKSPGKK